jgi:hypothetical protein
MFNCISFVENAPLVHRITSPASKNGVLWWVHLQTHASLHFSHHAVLNIMARKSNSFFMFLYQSFPSSFAFPHKFLNKLVYKTQKSGQAPVAHTPIIPATQEAEIRRISV